MNPIIGQLMALFSGHRRAYGVYGKELTSVEGGKLKGRAASLAGPVTIELWQLHVNGTQGLGIVPIDENSKAQFAAIDIDQYPLDLAELNARIKKLQLPLVLCRTKSGGAHLYCFLREPHEAAAVVRRMREFAMMLGYGNAEIFPKQTQLIAERGDVGQWINMPYFDSAVTTRWAMDDMNKQLDLDEFLTYATKKIVEIHVFLTEPRNSIESLKGGPPCLNHLVATGFPPGTRNNGLLNLGVYAKKIDPDNWRVLVEEYNDKYMQPPLTASEVLGVIKSLSKRDFLYMCKQPPIAQYCNAPKCRTCAHGIGGGNNLPKFGSLTKLQTVPPIWFLDVDGGGRLELSTEDLQSQSKFQLRCMESLNMMPSFVKREAWEELIQKLITEATVVEIPEEATPMGQFMRHLENFCTTKAQAHAKEEILLGKPWTHENKHYFKLEDLLAYLERQRFYGIKLSQIASKLKDLGATKQFFNLKGKGCNCYVIREFNDKQIESFDSPDQKKLVPF